MNLPSAPPSDFRLTCCRLAQYWGPSSKSAAAVSCWLAGLAGAFAAGSGSVDSLRFPILLSSGSISCLVSVSCSVLIPCSVYIRLINLLRIHQKHDTAAVPAHSPRPRTCYWRADGSTGKQGFHFARRKHSAPSGVGR